MSLDISQPAITQAIYRTILAAYTESPASGLPPACQGSQVYITYAWPGMTLDETDYQNPWSPDHRGGQQLATEKLSGLVNPVPLLYQAYTQSGNQVETSYQFILMATPSAPAAARAASGKAPAPVPAVTRVAVDGPEGSGAKKIADNTPDEITARQLEREYADASANLIAHRLQFDLTDPAGSKAWEAVASQFEAAVHAAWDRLQQHLSTARIAPPSPFAKSAAPATTAKGAAAMTCVTDPVAAMLNSANQIFTSTTLASIQQPPLTYHPSYASPPDFADPAATSNWPFVPAIKVTTPGNTQPNLSIAFRFCRVDIRRPWLLMNILEMQGWKIQGQPAGSLSTGSATSNAGSFPLLPESFVVARDLAITSTATGTELYAAKGLQILAWINRVTPFIPPSA